MKFRHSQTSASETKLQMSAMIDIVFLLLIFFIMTFRIVAQEGDFEMKATESRGVGGSVFSDPIRVRLRADAQGNLVEIRIGDYIVDNFNDLSERYAQLPRDGDQAVILDCDFGLQYEHAVRAIDAIKEAHKDGSPCQIRFAQSR